MYSHEQVAGEPCYDCCLAGRNRYCDAEAYWVANSDR